MSGYYYPQAPPDDNEEFDFNQPYVLPTSQPQQIPSHQAMFPYTEQLLSTSVPQTQLFHEPQQLYLPSHQYAQQLSHEVPQPASWITPTVPSNDPYNPQQVIPFPQYAEPPTIATESRAGPSRSSTGYLSPAGGETSRASRATSFTSNTSSMSLSDMSRSTSPNTSEMARWGHRNQDGTWSCSYPGCASRSTFSRGCDLRKHYKRHTKSLFCRYDGCPQAIEGGFSSKKDRARHEAKHNPSIPCEWEGCDRLFSRLDNMKDHARRVHGRKQSK